MFRILALLAISTNALVIALKPASEYLKICHKSDPDIASCIKTSIEKLRPQLIKGIPALKLVPLDPLFIPKLDMRDGQGNFKFRQTLSNLYIYGLRNFEIKNITVDMDKNFMTITCFTKNIDFDGDYDMAGKMMIMDLTGTGKATLNFSDVTTVASIQSEVITKKGVEYNTVKSLKWKIEPEGAKFHFTNLFNGDQTLGDATNKFLNDNWKEAYRVYKFLPEEAFGTLMKDLANRVFTQFPRDELFPA